MDMAKQMADIERTQAQIKDGVKGARDLKVMLERELKNTLSKFEEATGTSISGITLEHSLDYESPVRRVMRVNVSLEI